MVSCIKSVLSFYGDSPYPEHTSPAACSHKEVVFKENPGKKLRRHGKSIKVS